MSIRNPATTFNLHRAIDRRPRVSLVATAAAVLGLSLLLSISPALGANNGNSNGNGGGGGGGGGAAVNSGTVKVHDADTGVETAPGDNDPHVCDFWLGFYFDATFEVGTWVVLSWAPTGDGSTVASGLYDATGDGYDQSSVLSLDAGHYRVEWQANGGHSSKNKVLWVDEGCDSDEVTELEDSSPAEEPEDSSPAEEPEDSSPVEDSSPAEEPEDSSAAEDSSPAEDSSAAEEPEDSSPGEEPEQREEPSQFDEPTDVEEPAQTEDPSQAEEPTQVDEPEASDPGTAEEATLDGGAGNGGDTMPDTSLPTATGALTALGLLLVILGHAIVRRTPLAKR